MARFSKVAEFEALTGADALTPAETQLIQACREGKTCTLQDAKRPEQPNPERNIRSELLRVLITGGTPDCGLSSVGVWLEGAWITGILDLQFAIAKGQTVLLACYFARKPVLLQSRLKLLNISGSQLPGLFGQGMTVEGSIFIHNALATQTIDLNSADIGGAIEITGSGLIGTKITSGQVALRAQGAKIKQSLQLVSVATEGTVDLNGAQIDGQLDLLAVSLDGKGGQSLNAQGVQIGRDFLFMGKSALGTVDLSGATIIGQLTLTKLQLKGTGKLAFRAQRMHVTRGLVWRDVTVLEGMVYLAAAHVGDLSGDLGSWPEGEDQIYLDGFTYDRIHFDSIDTANRLGWLNRGSNFKGSFYPQPYTQLSNVLFQMGHDRDAREILIMRDELLAAALRRRARRKSTGQQLLAFENPVKDSGFLASFSADWLVRWVVGYGYAPMRSLGWLLCLFLIATTFAHRTWEEGSFAPNSDVVITSHGWTRLVQMDCVPTGLIGPCLPNPAATWSSFGQDGLDWDSFSPYGYAADLVIPILDLGQTDAWAPSKDRGPWGWWLWWGRWVLAAAGWVVTALGAAAVTGIIKRDRG